VVLDLANRALFSYVFSNPPLNSKIRSDLSFALNEEQSDILILGASRATHHYNSQIFIDSLGKTCYNAGQDGQPIYNQYLNLIKALENGKVETVILDLGPSQLQDEWINERIKPLSPFYWENDSVRAIIEDVSEFGKLVKFNYLSSFVQYSSRAYIFWEFLSPRYESQIQGYVPLEYTGRAFNGYAPATPFSMNEKAIKYMMKIRNLCIENGVKLYVVVSPYMGDYTAFVKYMSEFCKLNNLVFWDYSSDKRYIGNPYLWMDAVHMNSKGADEYTQEIVGRIANHKTAG
jgi:hypothetical protein